MLPLSVRSVKIDAGRSCRLQRQPVARAIPDLAVNTPRSVGVTLMSDPCAEWIKVVLKQKPHLSRSGLARHMGRHRSVVTKMIQGDRSIKVSELPIIEAYLGSRYAVAERPQAKRNRNKRYLVIEISA